jgi:hypothetical protein
VHMDILISENKSLGRGVRPSSTYFDSGETNVGRFADTSPSYAVSWREASPGML